MAPKANDDGKREHAPARGEHADEPRVRDVLRQMAPAADEATLSELMSWFELPSYEAVAAAAGELPGAAASDAQAIRERRERAMAHVDPTLVDAILRRQPAPDRIHRLTAPTWRPWMRGEPIVTFDDSQLPPDLDEWPEWNLDHEIRDWLKTCTPQAFLRDLYRPETEFLIQMAPPWDEEYEPPSLEDSGEARALLARSYKVGIMVTPAYKGPRWWDDHVAMMKAPWGEAKRDKARQREAALLAEEEARKARAAGPVTRPPEGSS
jgi:hypothetical protein